MDKPRLDEACLARLRAGEKCAVGVSGGSDSLALLVLLQAQTKAEITALTVDHGLRAEARGEAEYVAEICAARGISHEILPLKLPESGNLQANAREARYLALKNYCQSHDIPVLAVGHTMDDQVETYMMAAFRGSGVDGLSAMPSVQAGQPDILRPLLHLRREALRDVLRAEKLSWIEDPSNDNPQFDRVRMRLWLEEAEKLQFDVSGVARTIANMQRARFYLEAETEMAARRLLHFSRYQVEAQMPRAEFLHLHDEIALRILARLCQYYGGSRYKPRLARLQDLLSAMQAETGGMVFEKTEFHWSEKRVRVYAEPAHLPEADSPIWHNFALKTANESGTPLGPLGDGAKGNEAWREWGISARAAQGLPAKISGHERVLAHESELRIASFWESVNFD